MQCYFFILSGSHYLKHIILSCRLIGELKHCIPIKLLHVTYNLSKILTDTRLFCSAATCRAVLPLGSSTFNRSWLGYLVRNFSMMSWFPHVKMAWAGCLFTPTLNNSTILSWMMSASSTLLMNAGISFSDRYSSRNHDSTFVVPYSNYSYNTTGKLDDSVEKISAPFWSNSLTMSILCRWIANSSRVNSERSWEVVGCSSDIQHWLKWGPVAWQRFQCQSSLNICGAHSIPTFELMVFPLADSPSEYL